MSAPELEAALGPVLRALRELGVRHYVGGSIASSAHGIARASVDADVVAELPPAHVDRFVAALGEAYYVPAARIHDAARRRSSFNVIHLETMLKVDVFVSKDRPFDRRSMERAAPSTWVARQRPCRSRPRRTRSSQSSSGSGRAGRLPSGSGGETCSACCGRAARF
jgi:hypothetical protein